MTIRADLLETAVSLTKRELGVVRSQTDTDVIDRRFLAEFVAESESLEGHDTKPGDVLDSVKRLILAN